MRRFLLLLLLLLLPLGALAAVPPMRPPGGNAASVPNQVVLRFAPGVSAAYQKSLHAAAGARVVSTIPQLGIQTVQLPNITSARTYSKKPGVLWMEPNRIRRALVVAPNDPFYNQEDSSIGTEPVWYEWDARDMESLQGWSIWPNRYYTSASKGTDAVRIAVIDTGIDYDHPDFRNTGASSSSVANGGQLERPLDRTFSNGVVTNDAWDEHGHGTHVAGIAAAATNNSIGVTGTGYNANLMSLRVLDAAGNGTEADIARAIVYAADNGALIINCSLGGYGYSQAEQDAVNYAWSKGTLVIAAAGNDGTHLTPNYPAALSRVLAVSATSREQGLATYSNYGDYIGVAAPGGDFDTIINWFLGIYSTMPTYPVTLNGPEYGAQMDYDYLQGTSMASPQVVGLAALYAGQKGITQSTPNGPLKIWQAIQRGADDISGGSGDWNLYIGHGRINVFNTLNLDAVPNPRGAATGNITGQARYKGTPVPHALVKVTLPDSSIISGTSRTDGSFRIPGIPPGTYTVTATVFGESEAAASIPVTAGCDYPGVDLDIGEDGPAPTRPAAPSSLSAAAVSRSQILLSWQDGSGNESGFQVERKPAGGTFGSVGTAGKDSTLFLDSSLGQNSTYVYRVRAYNAAGTSNWSNEATATTNPAPPLTPTDVTAETLSSTRIRLTWTDRSPDEAGFKIERREGPDFIQIAIANPDVTAYIDNGLAPNTAYVYRLRAFNAGGDSPYSGTSLARTHPLPPDAPGSLKATALSRDSVRLNWTDNSLNEKGFRIERQRNTGGFVLAANVSAGVRTFTDQGLAANTLYTYRVRAYNDGGNSPWSGEAEVTTFPVAPAAPSNLTVTALSRSVLVLTWRDRSPNETAFLIERKTATTSFTQVASVPGNSTGYFDAGLASGASYTYRVRASNAGGTSAYSNEAGGSAGGGGGAGTLSVRPKRVTFPRAVPGSRLRRVIRLRNVGRGILRVQLGELPDPFSVAAEYRTFRIRPGKTRRIQVFYTAPSEGTGSQGVDAPKDATLQIASSDRRQPLVRVLVSAGK